MDVIRFAIARPVTVTVGVILVVMFGLIGFRAVPVQLVPNVDRPIVTVSTQWPGRSPEEVIDEITKLQEEQLKSIQSLRSMRSKSSQGSSEIVLEFAIGTDIDRALRDVSDGLRQVPDYPDDVEEPTISAADGAAENAIAWIIVDVDPASGHDGFDIATLQQRVDREVAPLLERVDGVAEINVFGGRERELQVLVDPVRLAERGLSHLDILDALRNENRNVSAGTIAEGKRDYRVRVLGQFETTDEVLDTIIAYGDGVPVLVRDVAAVDLGHVKRRGFVRSMGHPALAIQVIRQSGANVVEVMQGVRARVAEARSTVLPAIHPVVGPDLRIRQVYDETIYIDSAIDLVTDNLWIGGLIAAGVLLLFLRSFVATGVIAVAIPVSVVGTFLVLLALGRTLNVISLAGLAFATGMVVDNAIVVLENIDRHRRMSKPTRTAAYDGGREVIGAIVAATLTTVAVFVPVLTIQEEAGQLFRDISLAIVASVVLSLIVSVTVIPAACSRWLRTPKAAKERRDPLRLRAASEAVAGAVTSALLWLMTGWRGATIRPALVIALTAASLFAASQLRPPLDYLPAGNRNLVFGGLLIPPGYAVSQMERVAERIETSVVPYLHAGTVEEAAAAGLADIPRPSYGGPPAEPFPAVGVANFFIGSFGGTMFAGATSGDEEIVRPVGQLLSSAMGGIPDAYGGASQASLFGRGTTGSGIDVEVLGMNLTSVEAAAGHLFGALGGAYGFTSVRADPANFLVPQQEYRVRLTPEGRELGLSTSTVGTAVRALFDGAFAGEYRIDGDTIDIRVLPSGGRLAQKEQLAEVPVATPSGPIVPFDTLVELEAGLAPQEIRRIEELPAVTISLTPPDDVPLDVVKDAIMRDFVEPARASGAIAPGIRIRLEGTAAKLDEVRTSLLGDIAPESSLAGWQRAVRFGCFALLLAGVVVGAIGFVRAVRRRDLGPLYGTAGAITLALVLAGVVLLFTTQPQLLTARFVWAIIVVYLLMCALFESFVHPFVIMFTVPLALVGGFAGLRIVHDLTAADPLVATQNLDVLTMLGFVILVGVVVNNAILIVHQTLNLLREEPGLRSQVAVVRAVRTRVRPVLMGTMTSIGGMLPLVLNPGAGSELYRGLGSVVIGGLLVATVFTLLLVPLLFSLVLEMQAELGEILRRRPPAAVETRRHAPATVERSQGKRAHRSGAARRESS